MKTVLLTAFEPFGTWPANSSLLCLQAVLPQCPQGLQITARVYPVDFSAVREALWADLQAGYDFCVHLGQAQQTGRMRLEAVAINVGGLPGQPEDEYGALQPGGPVAVQSTLPLPEWAVMLRDRGIPAYVSYHAGTFLCNATLYWSRLLADELGLATRTCFIHVPLATSQVVASQGDWPTLPTATAAEAVRCILEQLAAL